MEVDTRTAPFLRWAGSKRWLAARIQAILPDTYGRYYEPFLGSAAIYLACATGHSATLSDTIDPLINCYLQVRDHPEEVGRLAATWSVDSESFYEVRSAEYGDPVRRAAQFIYLNKTCFNGLYRENQRGGFNVPFGRPKTSNVVDEANLVEVSARLRTPGTVIAAQDFEQSLSDCCEGDFVYLDPPYVAGHRQNGFVDYNAKLFSWEDQRRLAQVCVSLSQRGVHVVMSNADHSSVRGLFDDQHFEVLEVSRYSSMAARSGRRGVSDELLIVTRELAGRAVRWQA